ncbi:VOC family protein [Cocleimonas sp. KMM 6892]|uniref:VOC family protein n=1 Tax=unclassified Cocleimonas TaxID=2639732 RepID=UPI002DB90E7C|nr:MULTISPECIES: VOC family protein [unclassified Cocleimonas]MEB8431256.1 VOC family protein [Cocleimonas sp. KMM 6892]MEC4713972.1 VOC family protein [Cocleimonas sp. KMM 6895]MEC4743303.1 VOC family protein [Cocleimonas sp. KMM 6896]
MSNPMKQHGAFSWNELMTTDVAAAKAFYGKMFNWQMEDMEMDQPYTLAKIDDEMKAGLMPLTPECGEMPPYWGAYVTVNDVEASAKQAEVLGGKILLEPRDIPTVGRMCVISDPQGAALTIISYFEQE